MNIHWIVSHLPRPIWQLASATLNRREVIVKGFKLAWLGVITANGGFARIALAGNTPGKTIHTRYLQTFIDTLIPADAESPSASQLGVLDDIQGVMKHDALFARLVETGIQWLDINTQGRFDMLAALERENVLRWMEQQHYDTIPRRFLELLRDQVMLFYYAKPASWNGMEIRRPPQPIGYPAPSPVKFL